ncbi:MAG: hypothetical protein LUG51_13130 [Tannerellaceae bacterium]|nr:hypothetical protein [Tannerellaceae bacterium]
MWSIFLSPPGNVPGAPAPVALVCLTVIALAGLVLNQTEVSLAATGAILALSAPPRHPPHPPSCMG